MNTSENTSQEKQKKPSGTRALYEWVETFLLALSCVILIFTFVVKFVTVSGSSMSKTLTSGDRLLISDVLYTPKVGDIVVVDVSDALEKNPIYGSGASSPFIKRVIATEGQVVDIDPATWTLYVDGVALDEPYVYNCTPEGTPMSIDRFGLISYPYTVSEGCVFVMGDNRNGSTDSRFIGEVEVNNIIGKAIIRLFPRFGGLD